MDGRLAACVTRAADNVELVVPDVVDVQLLSFLRVRALPNDVLSCNSRTQTRRLTTYGYIGYVIMGSVTLCVLCVRM